MLILGLGWVGSGQIGIASGWISGDDQLRKLLDHKNSYKEN